MPCGCTVSVSEFFPLFSSPDKNLEDWAHREAYIVLREREAKGLEPISRDLIPAEEVVLPDDEELGDAPVMI